MEKAREERSSALISLAEVPQYPPYTSGISHCHPYTNIGICLSGEGLLKMGGKTERFSKGSLTLIPEGLHHTRQNTGKEANIWRYVVVDMNRLLDESPNNCRSVICCAMHSVWEKGICLGPEQAESREAASIIQQMFEMKNSCGIKSLPELEAALLLLLTKLARVSTTPLPEKLTQAAECPQIEAAMHYVAEHYAEEIQVEQMAKSCAMSESYFRRLFTQAAGCSPLEYVNKYRVYLAGEMLRISKEPIQNIACRAGFSSIATFNRNFKRYTGQKPSQWREQILQKES